MTHLRTILHPGIILALVVLALVPLPAGAQIMDLLGIKKPAEAEKAPTEAAPAAAATDATTLTPEQTQLIADLLRDPLAREALIAELERLANARAAATGAEQPAGAAAPATPSAGAAAPAEPAAEGTAATAPAPATTGEEPSFGRQIAQKSQEIAQSMAASLLGVWTEFHDAHGVFSGLGRVNPGILADAAGDMAPVIITSVVLFVILRILARRLYRWMGARTRRMGFGGTALVFLASVMVDAVVVLVAWAVGYGLGVAVFGQYGEIGIRQTLYLNSFLLVEMIKVAIRAVLSPAVAELRPVHVSDEGAQRTWRVANIVVSIIGYGQFLIVPIVNENVGYYTGRSVSALLLLIALVILAIAVIRHRRLVANWLLGENNGADRPGFWRALARYWYVPVLLYLAGLFAIVVARPGNVLLPVLATSAKVLVASVVGWAVAGMLGRAMVRGARLPGSVNQRLPLLERRLNTFVPRALFALRILILLGVVGYALEAMGLFGVHDWLRSDSGSRFAGTIGMVALILTLCFAAWLAMATWVDYRLNPDRGTVPTARESTLLELLRNAVTIALIIVTVMFVLAEIGIDIAPLIASAGIVGLAIGFGAQKLVQDIITGIFIQLENAINVGDVVTAGGISGSVERLTIRSVSLRDLSGVYHIIPFSSVDMVSNFMRGFAFALAEIGIAYRVDVEVAKQAMFDAFEELRGDPAVGPSIIGDLEWSGITQFGDSAVTVRARIKTLPGQQWGAGRAYNGIIKRIFDERGIEMPFPHRTLYLGEGTQGDARVAITSLPRSEKPRRAEAHPDAPEVTDNPVPDSPVPDDDRG